MERLTIPDVRVDEHTTRRTMIDVEAVREHAMEFYWRLKAYEETGRTPEEVTALGKLFDYALEESKTLTEQLALLNRIRDLAEADRTGRLAVLPCQSGEHVFALLDDQKHVRECEVKYAVLDGWLKVFYIEPIGAPGNSYSAPFGAFGQTVFLTREEAEKALEAMKDE